ncbi:MAG: lipid-A-disaccharide synthase, partial [Planctomycetota bacterium]
MTGDRHPGHPSELRVALVAGEHSGDHLGASLMSALIRETAQSFTFSGVGGAEMTAQGLKTIFPLEDVAVMGPL